MAKSKETEATEPGRQSLLAQPNQELIDKIRDVHERVSAFKADRKSINDKISAAMGELEALGISKKAAQAVFALYALEEEEQRRMYDLSAAVCRNALQMPQQGDLFQDRQIDETTSRAVADIGGKQAAA